MKHNTHIVLSLWIISQVDCCKVCKHEIMVILTRKTWWRCVEIFLFLHYLTENSGISALSLTEGRKEGISAVECTVCRLLHTQPDICFISEKDYPILKRGLAVLHLDKSSFFCFTLLCFTADLNSFQWKYPATNCVLNWVLFQIYFLRFILYV